ncbi:MAG: hypothetical protein CVU90_16085, partial [Firmicutes bacterium HGW-Firmicutes-15]
TGASGGNRTPDLLITNQQANGILKAFNSRKRTQLGHYFFNFLIVLLSVAVILYVGHLLPALICTN